jgi:hypothetical protein
MRKISPYFTDNKDKKKNMNTFVQLPREYLGFGLLLG